LANENNPFKPLGETSSWAGLVRVGSNSKIVFSIFLAN
jgi:hypothetical protein